MKPEIGIIGGMGPMASELFYKMITEHTQAEKDQDHINLILLSDASMPDRTGAILAGDYEKVRKQMLEDALFLQESGCKAAGVTCNTAHFFVDMIQDELDMPILHMIKLTAKSIGEECPGSKIGIMATDGTIKTGLYQKALEAEGLEPFAPCEEIQKEVMYQIYDRVKSGKPCDMASFARIEEEFVKNGCSKVILACTELSVIKADEGLGDMYIDPMLVLAKNLIEITGRGYK